MTYWTPLCTWHCPGNTWRWKQRTSCPHIVSILVELRDNEQTKNNFRLWQCYEGHDQGDITESKWEWAWAWSSSYGLGYKQDLSGEVSLDVSVEGWKGSRGSCGGTLLWALGALGLSGLSPPRHVTSVSAGFPLSLVTVASPAKGAICSSRSRLSVNLNSYKSVN